METRLSDAPFADPAQYVNAVRDLLRQAREHCGLSYRDVNADGLYWTGVAKLETGETPLHLWRVWTLAQVYDVHPTLLLAASAAALTVPWPASAPAYVDVADQVRRRLRARRKAAGLGVKRAAKLIGRTHAVVLFLEAGRIERLDLLMLHQLLVGYGSSVAEAVDWTLPA